MRSAGLRSTHYQTTQAYERGRTLEFSNKPRITYERVLAPVVYGKYLQTDNFNNKK
jgi:hypothetical protein